VLVDIAAVAVGLAAGVAAGYWIGRRWESDRGMLWTMAGVAFATAWIVDLAGYVAGYPEVSIGSIGLMAGVVTGVKYGGFSPLRGLGREAAAQRSGPDAPARDAGSAAPNTVVPPASGRGNAPTSEDVDASPGCEP